MIFSIADHIEQIVKGTKTQTRRDSPRYEVNHTYAIQPGRTKPADLRGRILITHKWLEESPYRIHPLDAAAEGGYAPDEYEELYEKLHPDWGERIVYEFEFWSTESITSLKKAMKEARKHPSIPYYPLPSRIETKLRKEKG